VLINMDTISGVKDVDTSFELFGRKFDIPVFAAPIGVVGNHYGSLLDERTYAEAMTRGCVDAGIAAFTGDGLSDHLFAAGCNAMGSHGFAVPTVKPWNRELVFKKIDFAKENGAKVMCMDIDASGLPFLKNTNPPSGSKSVGELKEIIEYADMPFILKGIMTPAAAEKAAQAGASGIIVSNHGGRVLDQTPATAWVLPKIAETVGDSMTVLVDGGIRTGIDIFKALALGADAVLIGRPFVATVYGGKEEGVAAYVNQLGAELRDAMQMCGPRTLKEITKDHLWEMK
jgi:isopentenyl diphosphate isomerase/L-lactate dehydrogenase-like FMN-dependent dehydrogenase